MFKSIIMIITIGLVELFLFLKRKFKVRWIVFLIALITAWHYRLGLIQLLSKIKINVPSLSAHIPLSVLTDHLIFLTDHLIFWIVFVTLTITSLIFYWTTRKDNCWDNENRAVGILVITAVVSMIIFGILSGLFYHGTFRARTRLDLKNYQIATHQSTDLPSDKTDFSFVKEKRDIEGNYSTSTIDNFVMTPDNESHEFIYYYKDESTTNIIGIFDSRPAHWSWDK